MPVAGAIYVDIPLTETNLKINIRPPLQNVIANSLLGVLCKMYGCRVTTAGSAPADLYPTRYKHLRGTAALVFASIT